MSERPIRPVRILIVDDHPVVRAGLTSMLGTQVEFEVVGLHRAERKRSPNFDRSILTYCSSTFACRVWGRRDAARDRRRSHHARAIILTSFETDEDIYRAVQAGAQGYLLKDTSLREMAEAIRTVHGGKKYFSRDIAARFAERMMRSNLTAREIEILKMLSKGPTNKEIGRALGISENTVKNHVNSIIEKLEVSDRTEAATTAIQRGIISVDE